MTTSIEKVLIANRGEISIRISRAVCDMGLRSVAIFSEEDRLSLHRFKAHEAYEVGAGKGPVEAYLDIDDILRIARENNCQAIHPGYGFLSENPDFAERCINDGIIFIGPSPDIMRRLGNKVNARHLAEEAGVPVTPATAPLGNDAIELRIAAEQLGLPVMLKASWGGGGRGMRVVRELQGLEEVVQHAKLEARTYFGNDEVYFEKLVENARHVEVQVLGDRHKNVIHLFERDCSLQRRHQKIIERAPAPYLSADKRTELCGAAVSLARYAGLDNAATVEFLYDIDEKQIYFIEVNPRVQVEHTVTEEITGIDIVKAQINIACGAKIGGPESKIPSQHRVRRNGHALQCRVTAEDPLNNFIPDYGHIVAYRSPAGPGIRLDGGSAYSGALINRSYDSLLVKITARGVDQDEAIARMCRALSEFRIRGVATNLPFLLQLLTHTEFRAGEYSTQFIDETPELFHFPREGGKVERLLKFIANVTINGNSEVQDRPEPRRRKQPILPVLSEHAPIEGVKRILQNKGAEAAVAWVRDRKYPLITDTTFRDAHQSLLATRVRSTDLTAISPYYARLMPELFSVESWGGATFDVALRFLKEDPWQRLHDLSDSMPNIMQQMLLRASNAVGYKNYSDDVVAWFIHQAANAGVDVFRIFDALNWTENMKVAMDAAGNTGKIVEAAICYTGDILDPKREKYNLEYYVKLAHELEEFGAHILGIKDMAGLLKPAAANILISALKQEIKIPIHFHTHDTSGVAAASVLAAVDAGVDIFDAAIDSMSGLTSQPNLGSLVAALDNTRHETGLNSEHIRQLSTYWDQVRTQYSAFEPTIHAGASEVYIHEMPGGQYTNLREQAFSMGLDESRWPEVAQAYSAVNDLFGDIVKVTPTSKIVGDMALAMVTGGLTPEDLINPDTPITFPDSVVSFFRGELGQPVGGFPKALQHKVLAGESPLNSRPGSTMDSVCLDAVKKSLQEKLDRDVTDEEIASYLMYPEVFISYVEHNKQYGDVSVLPTHVYFYGMQPGVEITLPAIDGRQVIIRYLTHSNADEDGMCRVFFEVNGQPQTIIVRDNQVTHKVHISEKADAKNPEHIAASMPGLVVSVDVSQGQNVEIGQTLLILEAMKMQMIITADNPGQVRRVVVKPDHVVDTDDLLLEMEIDK